LAFKLVYTDPKKKTLQKIEILLVVIMLPIGLFYGVKTYQLWQAFRTAEILHAEASDLVHAGRYDEGIPKLEAALKTYPPFYAAWEELGVSYHMLGDHQKEMETYLEATEILPENGNLYRELATAYHELGMHDKELEAAEKASTLENTDPLFTSKVLGLARKEASGEISTEKLKRPHTHESGVVVENESGQHATPSASATPGAEHGHEGHDHAGHDH
jgi:tetratricopeptide (TPR) repeat protein